MYPSHPDWVSNLARYPPWYQAETTLSRCTDVYKRILEY
jgi:hypothetical protein